MIHSERLSLSRTEAALAFNCSVSTVDRMIRSGELRVVKIGERRIVIPVKEVERFLSGKEGKP